MAFSLRSLLVATRGGAGSSHLAGRRLPPRTSSIARLSANAADDEGAATPDPQAAFPAGTPSAFTDERRQWRQGVSELRKKYAAEQQQRREEQEALKAATLEKVRQAKRERLAMKLARSQETKKRMEAERKLQNERFETNRAFTDQVREERETAMQQRLGAMVAALEEESKLWLTPERVDAEINEAFFEAPGIAGHFPERSPYWGYVAEVESWDGEDEVRSAEQIPRSKEEAMAMATNLMLSHTKNYSEYKQMRENMDGMEEFIDMLRTIEVEDGNKNQRPAQQARREQNVLYDTASAKPEMPAMQPEDQEKQKLEEQLARLRARRQRPAPDA